ncbi:unnamed protein product [Toxocara canis]|uniref:Nicotinate phosphoribosyltransferase n=1 Tax=Toxocara canis TaxID=6265 RepID=A0A183UCR9_TOXCA|nr:unnamed protein product [Toxocara canis]
MSQMAPPNARMSFRIGFSYDLRKMTLLMKKLRPRGGLSGWEGAAREHSRGDALKACPLGGTNAHVLLVARKKEQEQREREVREGQVRTSITQTRSPAANTWQSTS